MLGDPIPFPILPGVYTEMDHRLALPRWYEAQWMRWRGMVAEKIGGLQRQTADPMLGTCRAAHPWATLANLKVVGMGTHLKLYVYHDGAVYDVTPYRLATDGFGGAETELTDPFTTVAAASPLVSVAHTSHNLLVGDYVHFDATSPTFDNVTIDGEYAVTSVTSANAYVITADTNATSGSVNDGGTVDFGYELNTGADASTPGLGWGAGTWGEDTWGTARSSSSIIFDARVWSIVNWSEDMLACYRGGPLCFWDASAGVSVRATLPSGPPAAFNKLIQFEKGRQVVGLGVHDGTALDPMMVAWCDREDFTDWDHTLSTNTAGRQRLDYGTEIVSAIATTNEIVIATDLSLYSMYFLGGNDWFGFRHIDTFGGAAGPNSMVAFPGGVVILGTEEFFIYDGTVRTLPCDVHRRVFHENGGYNRTESFKIFGWHNISDQEVWWVRASAQATECDRYVFWNYVENHWGEGELPIPLSAVARIVRGFSKPLGVGTDGHVYAMESGVDADGAALAWSLKSFYSERPDSQYLMLTRLIPLFRRLTGGCSLTLRGRDFPQDPAIKTKGPFTVTSATRKINPRMRSKMISMELAGSAVGQQVEMDTWRVAARAGAGRRG